MTDQFSQRIIMQYKSADPWEPLAVISKEVHARFQRRASSVADGYESINFAGLSRDNKHFKRQSLVDLESAFRVNHANPIGVNIWIHGTDLHIWVHTFFPPDGSGITQMHIDVSSPDRMRTERFAKDLLPRITEARKLKRSASEISMSLAEVEVTSSDSGNEHKAGSSALVSASSAPLARPGANQTKAWLKAKWRDHTATFLITVVGGVLAVVAAA